MSSPERPDKQGTRERQDGDAPASDFGSFVSSSARKSFRQLNRQDQRSRRAGRTTTPPRARPAVEDRPEPVTPVPSGPIGRKWRDAVDSPPAARTGIGDGPDDQGDDRVLAEGGGGSGSEWLRQTFLDGDRPNRNGWIALAILLLAIVLLIFLLTQGDGDNGGEDVTPTATTTNVISTDRTATPPSGAEASPTEDADDRRPRATATEEDGGGIQEGGDNQRD